MKYSSRREFLQTSAMLTAAAFSGFSFDLKKEMPLLSFSTLGCPDWTFPQIVDFAVVNNYQGLELRGILREMNLDKCPEFNSASSRQATLALMKEKGLQFVDLGSSANLHFADPAERKKNLDEAKRFIDLAKQIDCPNIRVFPNNIPKGQEKNATIELMITGLQELGDYARGSKVNVLMETHGEIVKIEDLEKIMKAVERPNVGLIWDISNMWTVTKEPPAAAYQALKKYIRHTHIKDAILKGDKLEYALLGQGEVPIFEAIDILVKGGYKGYFSFEWEKLWHPEIAGPEIALVDYPKAMAKHFDK